MKVCERCTENNNCAWQNHEDTICHDAPAFPMTNADRIRSMSDEELAELFANNDCGYCRIHDFCFDKGCAINCEDMWLDWLKEEAKEGE